MNRLPPSSPPPSQPPSMDLGGGLLVAAPGVEDGLFARAVCLVLEHTADRSIGVVLNRPFALDIRPLWEQLTQGLTKTASPPDHLHFGGPNSGPVVAIHDRPGLAEGGNGNGVYMAAQVETLKKLTLVPPHHYRLLVGHALWEAGQLEHEILAGMWYPLPASPDVVFVDDFDMWQEGMRRVGARFVQTLLHLDGLPSSPLLN